MHRARRTLALSSALVIYDCYLLRFDVLLSAIDVDDTLVKSVAATASKLHRQSFAHCFKKMFGLDTDIDVIRHQGSTDPLIILAVLDKHGLETKQVLPSSTLRNPYS